MPVKRGHCFRCKYEFTNDQGNIFSCSSTSRAFHLHATLPSQPQALADFHKLPDTAKLQVQAKLNVAGRGTSIPVSGGGPTLPLLEGPLDYMEDAEPPDTSMTNTVIREEDWWDGIQWEDILKLEVNTSMFVPTSVTHAVATARVGMLGPLWKAAPRRNEEHGK